MSGPGEPQRAQARPGADSPAAPPHHVRFPVNLHRWDRIGFLHWPVDPAVLARLVPPDLTVLTHGGAAWVSVTPFVISVRVPGVPAIPGLMRFPETNVRTYVAGPDGGEGLWFLRMEVTRRWFAATLRALGLPYFRQRMTVEGTDRRMSYTSSEPRGSRLSHRVVLRPGRPLRPLSGGSLDRFLTARWGAYHRRGPLLMHTPADHPPWPLRTAEIETGQVQELLRSAGLPPLGDAALAHWSPGVPVRIGAPRHVG